MVGSSNDVCDNFLGREFITAKGGVFKIESLLPRERYDNGELKNAQFTATCSICSKDTELFPDKFIVSKSRILCGKRVTFPCACEKGICWSQYQYKVLLRRKLEGTDWRVISYWDTKDFKGRQTKLLTVCLKHNILKMRTIAQILDQNMLCKQCSAIAGGLEARKDIKVLGDKLLNNMGNFSLERCADIPKKFLYTCYDCKEDNYTVYGGCRYSWIIGYPTLRSGDKPCRCVSTDNIRLDAKEIEYKIKTICKEEGLSYRGWVTDYSNYRSKFIWDCSEGHECKTSVNKFVVQNQRCKTCANINRKISWSFQSDNVGEVDYLYFLNLHKGDETFVKIGRTNNPKRRFKEYSCKYNLNVLKVYQGLYEDVWTKEKYIHDTYKQLNYQPILYTAGFSQECYTMDMLKEDFTALTSDLKDNTCKFLYLNKEK